MKRRAARAASAWPKPYVITSRSSWERQLRLEIGNRAIVSGEDGKPRRAFRVESVLVDKKRARHLALALLSYGLEPEPRLLKPKRRRLPGPKSRFGLGS